MGLRTPHPRKTKLSLRPLPLEKFSGSGSYNPHLHARIYKSSFIYYILLYYNGGCRGCDCLGYLIKLCKRSGKTFIYELMLF